MAADGKLSTHQAARYCEVSDGTILYWEKTGRISATRTVGRRRRFDPADLDLILRQRRA